MFRGLLKKQFLEIASLLVRDRKAGKQKGKQKTASHIALTIVIMIAVMIALYGMTSMLGAGLLPQNDWLYCSMLGIMAILLGVFGSVFSTYEGLFLGKDNELLLSLPIPTSYILGVRMIGVAVMSLLYSALVWIPTTVQLWRVKGFDFGGIVFFLWSMIVIGVLVTALSCLVGWIVALISSRTRGKSAVTVIISLIFFGVYYYAAFRAQALVQLISSNSEKLGEIIHGWLYVIYLLGKGASGNWKEMVLVTLIVGVIFAITYLVMTKSFYKIATTKTNEKVKEYKPDAIKAQGMDKALFRKELKRFLASPTYMLNTGLGLVVLPVLLVFAIIKQETIQKFLGLVRVAIPQIDGIAALIIVVVAGMVVSMNIISTPSVSLEGKNLWIIQSLPVSPKKILNAKERLHFWLNIVPALLFVIVTGQMFVQDYYLQLLSVLIVITYIQVSARSGLVIGVKKANFDWTSESVPIKQSMNVIIMMFLGWIVNIVIAAGYYFLYKYVGLLQYLIGVFVVMEVVNVLLKNWLDKKGAELFTRL